MWGYMMSTIVSSGEGVMMSKKKRGGGRMHCMMNKETKNSRGGEIYAECMCVWWECEKKEGTGGGVIKCGRKR